nr:hypothetical protein [Tanacetum cinerariifolium]
MWWLRGYGDKVVGDSGGARLEMKGVVAARGESGVVDLIDRKTGNVLGVRRKRSPEKFVGGGR